MKLSEAFEHRAQRGPHRDPPAVISAARAAHDGSRHDRRRQQASGSDDDVPLLEIYPTVFNPHRRPRRLAAVIAAGVVVAGVGLLAITRHTSTPRTSRPSGNSDAPFRFATPTVAMAAASIEVIANSQSFVPTTDVQVAGDPGTPEYTTLELTWHERGIEQRIYLYFTSDGTNWWANEIQTYNGRPDGDWIEPAAQGQYFKSPLGVAFHGDLNLANLRIRDMTLEAFGRPHACDTPIGAIGAIAMIADYPTIDSAPGGFGATFQLLDTQTCKALPVAPYTFEYRSDDPTIVAIPPQEPIPDYPPRKTRLGLQLVAPGVTTIHAAAKDATGNVVATVQMHIVVRPAP
jgi:hypothetical protein